MPPKVAKPDAVQRERVLEMLERIHITDNVKLRSIRNPLWEYLAKPVTDEELQSYGFDLKKVVRRHTASHHEYDKTVYDYDGYGQRNACGKEYEGSIEPCEDENADELGWVKMDISTGDPFQTQATWQQNSLQSSFPPSPMFLPASRYSPPRPSAIPRNIERVPQTWSPISGAKPSRRFQRIDDAEGVKTVGMENLYDATPPRKRQQTPAGYPRLGYLVAEQEVLEDDLYNASPLRKCPQTLLKDSLDSFIPPLGGEILEDPYTTVLSGQLYNPGKGSCVVVVRPMEEDLEDLYNATPPRRRRR
jgi:hypothetical protein